MKILLVYPYCLEDRIHEEDAGVTPIGLFYLAALLRENGYDVAIFNAHGFRDEPDRIREILISREPDLIGFSVVSANRWGGIEIARLARRLNPDVHIVFGGPAATFLRSFFLNHFPAVDYTVSGEGEIAFLELIRCLEKGETEKAASVPGVGCRRNSRLILNPPAKLVQNLDDLPDPARYFTFNHLALSRGCPANCAFCGSPKFWGRRVRFHSADYFVGQMERLYRNGVRFFYISDDTFTLKKPLVTDICRKIRDRGLDVSWNAISRVDCVDAEILREMRLAGCIQISYGIESGDPDIRKTLNKPLKTEQIRNAFAMTRACGILPRAYFIYGAPGESRSSIQKALDLMDEIRPLAAIFYILALFPGTRLYDDLQAETGFADDIWMKRMEDMLWFDHDPDLSKADVLTFGKTLRDHFHRRLPEYAGDVELLDDPELYPAHADFLSRLAMTFSHGDYAGIEEIPRKLETAEALFRKALEYHPHPRAFLGLGMLLQKKRDFETSVSVTEEGMKHDPDSSDLCLCRAVSLMNLGRMDETLEQLKRIEDDPRAAPYIEHLKQGGAA